MSFPLCSSTIQGSFLASSISVPESVLYQIYFLQNSKMGGGGRTQIMLQKTEISQTV